MSPLQRKKSVTPTRKSLRSTTVGSDGNHCANGNTTKHIISRCNGRETTASVPLNVRQTRSSRDPNDKPISFYPSCVDPMELEQYTRGGLKTLHQVPVWLQFNQFIYTGYRPQMSVKRAFFSLFELHNETINIWTHLITFLGLVYLIVFPPSTKLYQQGNDGHPQQTLYLSCISSFSFIFLASTCYHLFMPCCRSLGGYKDLICVDVIAALISVSITTYNIIIFGDPCKSLSDCLVPIFVFTIASLLLLYAILSSTMSVWLRFLFFGVHSVLRLGICWYILKDKMYREGHVISLYYHFMGFFTLLLGGVVNSLRIPERFLAHREGGHRYRWIDYILNSHNIWHCLCTYSCTAVFMASYYQELERQVSLCIKDS